MNTLSRVLDDFAARVIRPLGKLVTLGVGIAMMIVGLAMTATIVMLPIGIVIGLLGVGLSVCALFAPRSLTEP